MAYDRAHNQVVLFGGENDANFIYADTWVWDGAAWTQKFPKTTPPARFSAALAYDSVHGELVLFGGNAGPSLLGAGYLNDTWVWNGANWTQRSPKTAPPARFAHAMAFDSARGQVVLFGGTSAGLFGDTWVWDGTNWSQRSPQSTPTARSLAAMTDDSGNGRVVLFGGNNNGALLNDTWLWDGSNWISQSPQSSPPAREGAGMAYDAYHHEALLFGGGVFHFNGLTPVFSDLNETWAWNGSQWTQRSTTGPSARDSYAFAYDLAHDRVVLFGGASAAAPNAVISGDTWTWRGAPLPSPSISGAVSASDFGGAASIAPGSWIEIYGSNLAAGPRSWVAVDFTGDTAPTSLDGVSVALGGQAAYVDYVSVTQVNAQVPSNIPIGGTVAITLTNGTGSSAPFNILANTVSAGLLAPASFQIGGKPYAAALLPDGTYVLPQGALPGVPSRPVKPGETITLYGIGFGPVTPDAPPGQIVPDVNQLSLPLQIMFGPTAATLTYEGLAPGSIGLYQFNLVVPAVPDSDAVPLTFRLGGVAGAQSLFTSVRQ
jgi:uncharacterized protein (TIGR03437 family)